MIEIKYVIFFFVLFILVPMAVVLAKKYIYIEKILLFALIFFTAQTIDINFVSMQTYRGTSKGFEISLVDITAIILFFVLLRKKNAKKLSLPAGTLLFSLYFLFSCISIINSDIYVYSFFELLKMIRMYFYFFLIYNLIRSFKDIEEFFKYMIIVSFFITFVVLKQKYLEGMFQTRGPFPHQNSLIMYMITYANIFLAYILNRNHKPIFIYFLAFAAVSIDIISTLSRGGMAVFTFSIFIIFMLSYINKFCVKKLLISFVFLLMASGILFKASDSIIERIRTAPEESLDVRVKLAIAAQNMANENIFGIGLNNFALKINPPYTYSKHIERKDDDEKGGLVETIYLLIAAETGWLNLGVFVYLLLFFYFINIQNYFLLKKGKYKKYRYIPIALFATLSSIYLQSTMEWVLKQTNNFYQLMFIFAIILAINKLARKERNNEKA